MIQVIFGSPIVILKFDNLGKILPLSVYDEMIKDLSKPENQCHPHARGGKNFTTDLNKNKLNQLKPLLDFLKHIGLKFSYVFSKDKIKNLTFEKAWINLAFEGCEIKNHYDKYHDTVFKSLTILYYPTAKLGGSNLVFIHNSKSGQWPSDCLNSDMVKIAIEEGNIIIFDNSTLHAVDVHKIPEPRMCIATEFKF